MKKTLIIFFTLSFALTSFSVVAKEYLMQCPLYSNLSLTYKLIDTPKTKNLYVRQNGEWVARCDDKDETYKHNGDGAVCTHRTKLYNIGDQLHLDKEFRNDVYIFDFVLNTHTTKSKRFKNRTVRCRKLK